MQRGPHLTLPALPAPGFTAEIRVRNGSSVGCWLGQAGSWGRRWDPPASASREPWEEGGGPEALAGGKRGHRHRRGHGSSFSWAPSPPPPTPAPRDEASGSQQQSGGCAGEGAGGEGRGRLAEELEEAVLAVRLVVLLLERALVELLEAEGADEVLRVELLGHGGDAAARDGLLAARAQGAPPLVVVRLAVGLPLVLEEAAVDERREALLGRGRAGSAQAGRLGAGQGTVRAVTLEAIPPRQAFSTCRAWR